MLCAIAQSRTVLRRSPSSAPAYSLAAVPAMAESIIDSFDHDLLDLTRENVTDPERTGARQPQAVEHRIDIVRLAKTYVV